MKKLYGEYVANSGLCTESRRKSSCGLDFFHRNSNKSKTDVISSIASISSFIEIGRASLPEEITFGLTRKQPRQEMINSGHGRVNAGAAVFNFVNS